MSKLFSGKRYFLKPIKQQNNNDSYVNQSMQDILDSYTKNQPGISNNFSSFNKNNITVDYPKHYSPSYRSPVSLPPISGKNRRSNNSQKKPVTKKLGNSNSFSNLYSQSLFAPGTKKQLEREKTQINLIENNLEQNKNSLNKLNQIEKMNNGQNGITQINNITNINIHIYQNNTNKTVDNVNKDDILQKNDSLIPESSNFSNNNINNDTMNTVQNPLFRVKQNKINNNSTSSLIDNAGM